MAIAEGRAFLNFRKLQLSDPEERTAQLGEKQARLLEKSVEVSTATGEKVCEDGWNSDETEEGKDAGPL